MIKVSLQYSRANGKDRKGVESVWRGNPSQETRSRSPEADAQFNRCGEELSNAENKVAATDHRQNI